METAPRTWAKCHCCDNSSQGSEQPQEPGRVFVHPTSKRGYETPNLPRHVALTKRESKLYPLGSGEVPKKEREDFWNEVRFQVCSPKSRAPSSRGLSLLPHNSVSCQNAGPLKFIATSPGLPLPWLMAFEGLSPGRWWLSEVILFPSCKNCSPSEPLQLNI